MSDTTSSTAPETSHDDAETPKPTPPAREETDWKVEARKWESRAKANADAADRLKQYEDAQKTAEQKAAEREAEAEKRAALAEARAVRREVALDPAGDGSLPALSKADAELLDALTDEDAMRRLAARLAAAAEASSKPNTLRPDPAQRRSTPPADDKDATARAFFGIQ